jgi:nucleotide-binding universal stress UspA family protein
MYTRIVLAYDGTREGIIALREGALLAKKFGAQVFLLSVLPEGQGLVIDAPYGDVVRQQMASYKALLARGHDALERLGLNPTAKLVVGEPAVQIGAYAAEVKADLVVLGHRRQNLLQRWWSGSTGSYVSDHVTCSVLVGRNVITDEAFQAELAALAALATPGEPEPSA